MVNNGSRAACSEMRDVGDFTEVIHAVEIKGKGAQREWIRQGVNCAEKPLIMTGQCVLRAEQISKCLGVRVERILW